MVSSVTKVFKYCIKFIKQYLSQSHKLFLFLFLSLRQSQKYNKKYLKKSILYKNHIKYFKLYHSQSQ